MCDDNSVINLYVIKKTIDSISDDKLLQNCLQKNSPIGKMGLFVQMGYGR